MSALAYEETTAILRNLGFRMPGRDDVTLATAVFQGACRLDAERLDIDGVAGEKTSRLLRLAEENRRAGRGTVSRNFSFAEFACRCGGKADGCRGLMLSGALVDALELIRSVHYRDGLHVVSGYRCPVRNGGTAGAATNSQHQWGAGCDIAPRVKTKDIAKLGVVSGIGYSPSTGRVVHVDVRGRPAGPGRLADALRSPNATGGTLERPSTFADGK